MNTVEMYFNISISCQYEIYLGKCKIVHVLFYCNHNIFSSYILLYTNMLNQFYKDYKISIQIVIRSK